MITVKKWLPALLLAMTFAACSEPDSLGIEVQPSNDQPGVYFTDTTTIVAETIREDSLRTDEGVALFNLAGSYTDPGFGMSKASFYTQFRLPNNNTNFTFGISPVLDSVVLTLAYADYYGDTLSPLSVEVLQLDQALYADSSYYSTSTATTGAVLFPSTSLEMHPKDSIEISGSLRAPHLRLRLPDQFGTDFINSSITNFINNTVFTNYFKGLHVRTAVVNGAGQGVIIAFNLQASMSKLTFYYTNASSTTQLTANFEVNSECPRFNAFEHDYTIAAFGSLFPVPGNDELYVQSMAGLKVRLIFPYIKNLAANGPLSINKAELVIPAIDNAKPYTNHQSLITFGVDSKGKEAVITDLLESSSYYGGTFSSTTQDYRFNIGRYVQQLISGKIATDYGLSIVPSGGAITGFRTIIPGTNAPGTRIKLNLTYSVLN